MFHIENPFARFLNWSKNYGLENTIGRWYSNYLGRTEDNIDPQQQGRVKVSVGNLGKVQGLSGTISKQKTLDLYAYPSSPYAGADHGFYFPPEKNDRLWVWFDHGSQVKPHVMGSLWGNSTPTTSSDTQSSSAPATTNQIKIKSPLNSQVPYEFNSATNLLLENNNTVVKAVIKTTPGLTSAPTTRGIKSGGGHGILLEDDTVISPALTAYGRENRLELWTGSQPSPPKDIQPNVAVPSIPAIKHHRFVMSDALQNISITSFGKHSTIYDDRPITKGIRTVSTLGLTSNFDDVKQSITLSVPSTAAIVINNLPLLPSISLTSALKQSFIIDDSKLSISMTTLGKSTFTSGIDASYQSGGTMEIGAGGVLTISANGIIIQSKGTGASNSTFGGAVNNTFVGVVKENYKGDFSQSILGTYALDATQLSLVSAILQLGKNAAKFRLVDERFIAVFNAHTHAGPGLPPTILITPLLEPLMLTSDVTAS